MATPRMRAADYRRIRELEAELGWELSEIPPDLAARYDWNRYGHPSTALFNRFMGWVLIAEAVMAWPLFLWIAVASGPAVMLLAPLLISAVAVVHRLALRKAYGVRS